MYTHIQMLGFTDLLGAAAVFMLLHARLLLRRPHLPKVDTPRKWTASAKKWTPSVSGLHLPTIDRPRKWPLVKQHRGNDTSCGADRVCRTTG